MCASAVFPRIIGRGARNIEGARGLRWRGTEEEGALARPDKPKRCTLPITALRVIPPSSPAIWLADRPLAHSFFKSSTRSSVQVCNSGRFWSKKVIGLCSTLPLWPLPRAESPADARRPRRRTHAIPCRNELRRQSAARDVVPDRHKTTIYRDSCARVGVCWIHRDPLFSPAMSLLAGGSGRLVAVRSC